MTYTEEAKQALSRKVCRKYKIGVFSVGAGDYTGESSLYTYLHDDWHTIMELCLKHGVFVVGKGNDHANDEYVNVIYPSSSGHQVFSVYYKDCASPSESERIARLLALGEL